jgi:hypothetical protein
MTRWPFATKLERADTLEAIGLNITAPLLYSTALGGFAVAFRLRSASAAL